MACKTLLLLIYVFMMWHVEVTCSGAIEDCVLEREMIIDEVRRTKIDKNTAINLSLSLSLSLIVVECSLKVLAANGRVMTSA
jgi:hypothetical protein